MNLERISNFGRTVHPLQNCCIADGTWLICFILLSKDGPSAGKLHANDQILKINDEDVHDLPQADVILRIK